MYYSSLLSPTVPTLSYSLLLIAASNGVYSYNKHDYIETVYVHLA